MAFKARLNVKFYIVSILLLGLVIFGWYGTYFLNANEILMEDNTPMDPSTKLVITILFFVIILSWTVSFWVLFRQMLLGYAFTIDEEGIHGTATAINLLSFIFVMPVRTIPFSAIERVSKEDGILTLYLDKAKIDAVPILRLFVRKRYHLFSGFTVEKQDAIKAAFEKYRRSV